MLLLTAVSVTIAAPARAQFGFGLAPDDSPWSRGAVFAPPVRAGQSGTIEGKLPLRRLPEVTPVSYTDGAALLPPANSPYAVHPTRPPGAERLPPTSTRPAFADPALESVPAPGPDYRPAAQSFNPLAPPPAPLLGTLPPQHSAVFCPPIVPPGAVGLNYQTPAGAAPVGATWFDIPCLRVDQFHLDFMGRAAYENDQRIEWTGVEATFGVEGSLLAGARKNLGMFTTGLEAEILLNQPFDRNILADTAERRSYLANWDIDPVQISQLYLTARRNDFMVAVGKMTTPFGRTYFPLYENDRSDAPFIRTESILWRETGFLMQWDPRNWVMSVGLMNGGPEKDANSSKGLVARVGYETDWMAIGSSIKQQDGIGSEQQKTFNNHVGFDGMVRRGPWTLSGEVIYDLYGFRRQFDPLDSTWGRSIYYRDQNIGPFQPITGLGYYANLGYSQGHWTTMLNFGQFHPKQIGDARHDVTNWRAIAKVIWHFGPTDTYLMCLWENNVPGAQDGRLRQGVDVLAGFQLAL